MARAATRRKKSTGAGQVRAQNPRFRVVPGERRDSMENPSTPLSGWNLLMFASASSAVRPENILRIPPVFACVNILAQTIASLPLQVFVRDGETGKKLDDANPLYYRLHDAVSDDETSYKWRRQSVRDLMTHGVAYTWIRRSSSNGSISSLHRIRFDRVSRLDDGSGYAIKRASTGGDNSPAKISNRDMLVFDYMNDENDDPMDFAKTLDGAANLYFQMQDFARRYFENDARPGLVAMHPNTIGPDAVENLKRSIEERFGGKNRFKPMVLEEGMKVETLDVNLQTAEFSTLMYQVFEEIARVYRIPPSFLQDLRRGTYNNTEQQNLQLVQHTLVPLLTQMEAEMNLKLFGRDNFKNFAAFNVDGLLRGDFATRMTGYATGIQNGILKPNEARRKENLPDDPDGDHLYIQQNMSELDQLGAQQAASKAAPTGQEPADMPARAALPPININVDNRRARGKAIIERTADGKAAARWVDDGDQ